MDPGFMFSKPTFPNDHFHRLKPSFFNLSFFLLPSLSFFFFLYSFLSLILIFFIYLFHIWSGTKHIPELFSFLSLCCFCHQKYLWSIHVFPELKTKMFLKNHLSLILTNNNRHNFKRVQDPGHNHLWCSRSPERRSSEDGDTREIQAQFLIDKAFHTCLKRLFSTAVRWFSAFRRKARSGCRLLCL